MSSELRVVVTTFPDRESAEKAAGLMVDAGLAVCAQVGADLVSFYRWDGTVFGRKGLDIVKKES